MLPKVVIVGRPNVGKSSLLNMLAGRRVSIVDPTPGVTRDRVSTIVTLPPPLDPPGQAPVRIEVIDTGGYGIEDSQNLTADVERQIALGLDDADLVLFVVDSQSGILPLDRQVAQLLRRGGARPVGHGGEVRHEHKPVLLVANKVDSEQQESNAADAATLGFGEPVTVSAAHGYNRTVFMESLRAKLPDVVDRKPEDDGLERGVLLAIVGKRNAGKSTLVNALAGSDRMIVSELEGTTRDSVDVRFEMNGKIFTAIDTAGLRRTKSLQNDIEYYSQHRALRSIRRADVVLLVIDATLPVSQVDVQLAMEVQRHMKATLIVINKWDLAQDKATQEQFVEYLDKELQGLNYAPVAFVSAQRKEGLREVVAMSLNLHQQSMHRVSTSELNKAIHAIMAERPPTSGIGRQPRIYYVTQTDVRPPTIMMFVNDPSMFDPTYRRFLINRLRDVLPFAEVPINLIVRPRSKTGGFSTAPEPKSNETETESEDLMTFDEMGEDDGRP